MSVDATPPQGIDRDALITDAMRMLYEHSPSVDHEYDREEAEELVDRMLLHGSYLTAAPDRDIIAAAIQTDFDVRNSAALRVADRILALVRPVPPQGIDRDALTSARRRIAVLYMAGVGGEAAALDLRLAIDEIDAALALVQPVPPQGIDRDALLSELSRMLRDDYEGFLSAEEVAAIAEYQTGRILALGRPLGIDRDALVATIAAFTFTGSPGDVYRLADAVLALVRPVEGIVISRQDAADLAFVAQVGEPHVLDTERAERVLALANRLEGLS
jgi:hypothetical protein